MKCRENVDLWKMPRTRIERTANTPMVRLEPRLVFAAVAASAYEQYMLELINRARANPAAEAARLGVQLNEGVTGTQISTAAKQPLVMNAFLTGSARDHVTWLRVHDLFQHEGINGSTPQQRMAASGYSFGSNNYGSAENLGLTLGSTLGDLSERTETLYKNLFVDANVAGRGHRTTLLNNLMEEVGIGVVSGDYTYNGHDWTGILTGQDFAYNAARGPFLTGVVYKDNLDVNDFYSPGEGKAGFTISVIGVTTAGVPVTRTTVTDEAGGYAMQIEPGTYTVTAVGSGITGVATFSEVVVGTANVKRDFEAAQFTGGDSSASAIANLVNGTLTVSGTTKSDRINVFTEGANIAVQVGDTKLTFVTLLVKRVSITAGTGNDYVVVGEDVPSASILGGAGNDTLVGTANADFISGGDGDDVINGGGSNDVLNGDAGNDSLNGEGGKDLVHGGDGNDRVQGAGGNDVLFGDGNDDRVYGGAGNDQVDGGGNVDRLFGEDGDDTLTGGGSNDRLYGGDGDDDLFGGRGKDIFDGGAGTNHARDREDIESVLNALIG